MYEITERTTVTEPGGSQKVLLPGRITDAEAKIYGLTAADETASAEKAAKSTRKKA